MDLCAAIADKHLICFTYDGHRRIVIPAAHGTDRNTGEAVLHGYQVRGDRNSESEPPWRRFLVSKMHHVEILGETFNGPPPDYRHDGMDIDVCCQL